MAILIDELKLKERWIWLFCFCMCVGLCIAQKQMCQMRDRGLLRRGHGKNDLIE